MFYKYTFLKKYAESDFSEKMAEKRLFITNKIDKKADYMTF
jgi:hypothetical protein